MPAKDIYHDIAKNALIKDGWNITQDPLWLRLGKKDMFIMLLERNVLKLVSFDPNQEVITRWIP